MSREEETDEGAREVIAVVHLPGSGDARIFWDMELNEYGYENDALDQETSGYDTATEAGEDLAEELRDEELMEKAVVDEESIARMLAECRQHDRGLANI